jgi:hypothetical protein
MSCSAAADDDATAYSVPSGGARWTKHADTRASWEDCVTSWLNVRRTLERRNRVVDNSEFRNICNVSDSQSNHVSDVWYLFHRGNL